MKGIICCLFLFACISSSFAQKKPLDPTVYDGWENISERMLSPDGRFLVYTVTPQEGDARLVIQNTAGGGTTASRIIPRGANVAITDDSRYLVFLIKPTFRESREAKIKKQTPDQSPKDTLAWIELGKDSIIKIPRVKSFRIPERNGRWLAYLLEKPLPKPAGQETPADSLTRVKKMLGRADSLAHLADSLRAKVAEIQAKGFPAAPATPASAGAPAAGGSKPGKPAADVIEEGTDLVLVDMGSGQRLSFPLARTYLFSKWGDGLAIETSRKTADSLVRPLVLWVHTGEKGTDKLKIDTVLRGFNEVRNMAFDEGGTQMAFVAERDSVQKALVKFYRLWYYRPGMDSAEICSDRRSLQQAGAFAGKLTVSPDFENSFSKDGRRLFFGMAPVRRPKDTTLVEFETARLDVWHYNDDYLQPQQLVGLNNELKRSYLAMIDLGDKGGPVPHAFRTLPLGDTSCEMVTLSAEGNGDYALGQSTRGYRIQQQWEQSDLRRLYVIDLRSGTRRLIGEKIREGGTISPAGKFVLWYDTKGRNWYAYDIAGGKAANITKDIHVPLFDEEDDHPDDPPAHGSMGWKEQDEYVYIYDRYDIWQCDPKGIKPAVCLTGGMGRKTNCTYRYIRLDREERYFREGQLGLYTIFNKKDMSTGLKLYRMGTSFAAGGTAQQTFPSTTGAYFKSRYGWTLGFLQGSFDKSNDVYVVRNIDSLAPPDLGALQAGKSPDYSQFSHINPQQASYNWYTVELHQWKMLDGRMSQGLLYKPENFDSTKKYPVIFYFYERDAETRYNYVAPQPVRSVINIPYFVSNGYIVFDPNIYYHTGQPGEDAYNSVVSAAKWLSHYKWVDTTKMGIEGHSWGGYQVAYLITRTNMFAAAEAGAPVANMTSAYGGIRWGAGISREFQYEHSQSRIGATLWQRPDLYIRNSPLFRADKVKTPLLMMHNDADGAVPWYQGIEYFTALRRLGKQVWMMQYNGEDHGLMERRNRKDWTLRMSQFFDYYLKGAPPAKWIIEGVPATLKGIDWGLGTEGGTGL